MCSLTNEKKQTSARRALALTREDKMHLVFSLAWGERVFGLIFLGLGLIAMAAPFVLAALGVPVTNTLTNEETGMIIGLLFGGLFLFVGTVIGLTTDRFHIDLISRVFTDSSGFPLFTRTRTGSFEEFDRLELEREYFESNVDTPRGVVWRAKLVWKDASRAPVPLTLHFNKEVRNE